MTIVSPILAFLTAESFSISGLLAIMVCSFIQSLYGHRNLKPDRGYLLISAFRALSYSSRAICDILIGINFGLNLHTLKAMHPLHIVSILALV